MLKSTREASPFAATRRRLLLMNLLVVSAMIGVMAVAVYAWEAYVTDQQITQDVMERADHDTSHNLLLAPPSQHMPNDGDDDPGEFYEASSPNIFTVLVDAQGHVVDDPGNVASLNLPAMGPVRAVLAGKTQSSLVTVGDDQHAFRLYTVAVRNDHSQIVGALQVGMSLASRSNQLHGLLYTLLIVGAGMLALTALASLFLTGRALAPSREAYERERRFVAAASHELRTPLAILRSQAELVARHLRQPAVPKGSGSTTTAQTELASDVDEITDEVDYMTRLVRDLLTIARPDDDRNRATIEPVDLWTIAENCVTKVRSQAEARALTLTLSPAESTADEPLRALGEPDRLRQLLLILLENALTYTSAGGAITVEVAEQSGRHPRALLRVRDTGKGIAAADLPHIFEPFYRADPARGHGNHTGSGLGLALAQNIAHAFGGDITATSQPGTGSTFTVSLPVAE